MGKWEKVRLGDVAPIQQSNLSFGENERIWYLNLDAVESNSGEILEVVYEETRNIGASTIAFDTNNVLYSKLRPYLNKVVAPFQKGYATSEMLPLKPKHDKLNRDFLVYYLRSKNFVKIISEKVAGAKMPRVVVRDLLNSCIPLPHLEEQRKIAATLDAVADLLKTRKQQLAELDKLVKSQFIEMFGDSLTNPMGWEVKPLKVLYRIRSSRRVYQSELTQEGIPFLRVSDLVQKISTGINTCELYISEEHYCDLARRSYVPKNDDILVTSRGTLGLCYIVRNGDRFYFQDGMISWLENLNEEANPVFISYCFGTDSFKRQMDECSSGTTVNYLSLESLGKIQVMNPPLPLQNRFADFVRQVDQTKSGIQQSIDQTQALFDSLMSEYFE